MRIKNTKEDIDSKRIERFFSDRAKNYNNGNPYSVTMLQDDNPELVKQRNERETKKIIPLMELDEKSRVLDIACGIGRWSDAIEGNIDCYCGIDCCDDLIEIAKERNSGANNRNFYTADSGAFTEIIGKEKKYNRVLLVAGLLYMNDEEVLKTFREILKVVEKNTVLCIREPIGIEERLTLKGFFSEELKAEYNAIYRTRDELVGMLKDTFLEEGFEITEEDFLFEESKMNNRKETSQYYFILKR